LAIACTLALAFAGCSDTGTSPGADTGTYTVTFNANGGTLNGGGSVSIARGSTVSTSHLPTADRTGYVFSGWNTAASGDGTDFDETTKVTGDIAIYVKWTALPPDSYAVTFDTSGGSLPADFVNPQIVVKNSTVSATPTLEDRVNYSFRGWFTGKNGGGARFDTTTPVTATITVYAWWSSLPSYQVAFYDNYPSPTGVPQYTTARGYEDGRTALPTPKRNNYRLADIGERWNTKEDGTGEWFDDTTPVTAHISVYAQWVPQVTFEFFVGNAVTSDLVPDIITGKPNPLTIEEYESSNTPSEYFGTYYVFIKNIPEPLGVDLKNVAHRPEIDPTAVGYTFVEWCKANAAGTPYEWEKDVGSENIPILLYAKWKANTYTVEYDVNGGTGTVAPTTHTYDVYGNLGLFTTDTITRTNYDFDGWNTAADGTGRSYLNSQSVINLSPTTDTVTLYAKWKPTPHRVTFNGNGGTPASTIVSGSVLGTTIPGTTIPAVLRTGYALAGWSTTTPPGDVDFDATTPVTAPINVYAKWTANTYTVTYEANFGTGSGTGSVAPSTHTFDEAKTLTANAFEREGYTFDGWSMPASGLEKRYANEANVLNLTSGANVILYAQWKVIPWTVYFESNGGAPATPVTTPASLPPVRATGTIDGTPLPANPSRQGFRCVEWNTQADGEGTKFTRETPVTGDITVYAVWRSTADYVVSVSVSGGDSITLGAAAATAGDPVGSIRLTAQVLPYTASQEVTWHSDDELVATVVLDPATRAGIVTAVAPVPATMTMPRTVNIVATSVADGSIYGYTVTTGRQPYQPFGPGFGPDIEGHIATQKTTANHRRWSFCFKQNKRIKYKNLRSPLIFADDVGRDSAQ
jgi:uncharacterized repeat protein (TIGR02543 family)